MTAQSSYVDLFVLAMEAFPIGLLLPNTLCAVHKNINNDQKNTSCESGGLFRLSLSDFPLHWIIRCVGVNPFCHTQAC